MSIHVSICQLPARLQSIRCSTRSGLSKTVYNTVLELPSITAIMTLLAVRGACILVVLGGGADRVPWKPVQIQQSVGTRSVAIWQHTGMHAC